MNNFTIKPLLCSLFILLGCFSLFAQNSPISFDIVKDVENRKVDIVAKEFQNVVGFQFGIKFDQTDLNYEGMEVPQDEIEGGNILDNRVGNNILLVYVSANTQPVSFEEGTIILSYKFTQDITDVFFCASEEEIAFEGAIDVDGELTSTPLIFSEVCDEEPSPCVLVCNDQINFSIPSSGTLTFTETGMHDMFLEGNLCDSDNLKLTLYDSFEEYQNGIALDNMTFTADDDGRTLVYEIREQVQQIACWGNLVLSHRLSGDLTQPADRDAKCGEEIGVDGISDSGAPLFYVSQDNNPIGSFGAEDEMEEIGRYDNISGVITGLSVYVVDEDSNIDNCNLGTLVRKFHLLDANGSELQIAIQNITITAGIPFDESQVTFPEDITVECEIDPSVTGSPEMDQLACQLLANSYMDETFPTDDGQKIIRTWTVIDWCSGNIATSIQTIQSICDDINTDTEGPVAICLTDLSVSLDSNGEAKIYAEDIDAGSYDNDGSVSFAIKRVGDDDFEEFIQLTIADIGTIGVNLLVIDEAGNTNSCWTNLHVFEFMGGADCILVCNAEVVFNIEEDQTVAINQAIYHPLFINEGTSCPDGSFIISLFDLDGNDISSRIFNDQDNGFTGSYLVTDINSQNTCFGGFTIAVDEDGLVWPGDTNNDGIVNNFDVLNIGIGYEAEGSARTNASIDWTGQEAIDWDHRFDDGLNFKFADADGLGSINFSDIEVIEQNWENEHDFQGVTDQSRFTGSDVPIFFQTGDYETNKLIEIPIHLGVDNLPAENIYGIAFSVNYDPSMVDASSINISYDDSWLALEETDVLSIERNDIENGVVHFAMVRKDHQDITGIGVVANLQIFFNEINEDITNSKLSLDNLRFVNAIGQELPALNISSTVNIENQTTTATTNINPLNLSVFPNPTTGFINIESNQTIESISLMKLDGSICKNYQGDVRYIDISHLDNQMYLLKIQTNNESVISKVVLLK